MSLTMLTYSSSGSDAILGVLFLLIPLLFILAIAGYIVGAFFLMKLFEKAGVEGKWRAWVPYYNFLVMSKLGDVSPWWMLGASLGASLLSGIPVLGQILWIVPFALGLMYAWRVGLKLGKEWYLLLLWIIPFGFLIWLGILALGASKWNPNIAPAPWGQSFIADKTVWSGIPVQPGAPPAAPAPPAPPAAPTV